MRTLGNILWLFLCGGIATALSVFVFGFILTIMIIPSPLGVGLMEFGKFLFWPFGNAMVDKSDLNIKQNVLWKTYSFVFMILYFPFGVVITIVTIAQIILLCVTIVGIPHALVLAKSLSTLFNPINKKCVPSSVVAAMENERGQDFLDRL